MALLLLLVACHHAPADTEETGVGPTGDTAAERPVGLEVRPANPACAGFAPPDATTGKALPRTLSETGCVEVDDPRLPADGLIPYDLNASFWSDGATKARYMGLPDGQTVTIDAAGDLHFPVGTVLVKTFDLQGLCAETRLLVRHADGEWAGYSYYWADQRDATLLDDGGLATIGGQDWYFPGPYDCAYCHGDASGNTLGPEVPQLDRDITYGTGVTANQLDTLAHIGVFDGPVPDLPVMPDPLGTAPLEDRARSWLHTNCSHCHRPGGPTGRNFDLRYTTPLADAGVCGVEPVNDVGVEDARLIAPGDPARSAIPIRMGDQSQRMPPLGSLVPDADGVALISEWITSLSGCP